MKDYYAKRMFMYSSIEESSESHYQKAFWPTQITGKLVCLDAYEALCLLLFKAENAHFNTVEHGLERPSGKPNKQHKEGQSIILIHFFFPLASNSVILLHFKINFIFCI